MRSVYMAVLVAGLLVAPVAAGAHERVTNAALGALAGAVVAGPVGAVAGGAIGYTAGHRIARGLDVGPRGRLRLARRTDHISGPDRR